ncbi:MAG: T9SS type A sorting domain-containing protein [Flavobacteriales bacterium]|nr:T9SS type A sorting domain-containing protein [Flavobacteriales bacterium]
MRLERSYLLLALCLSVISAYGQDDAEMIDDAMAMNNSESSNSGRFIEVIANPEQDAVRVRTPENAYFMELIDASGSVFRSGTVRGDERFDLIGLPAGTYTIQLRTFDGPMQRELEIK